MTELRASKNPIYIMNFERLLFCTIYPFGECLPSLKCIGGTQYQTKGQARAHAHMYQQTQPI